MLADNSPFIRRRWGNLAVFAFALLLFQAVTLIFAAGPTTRQTETLSNSDGPIAKLELVIPFYEGIIIQDPLTALPDAGLTSFKFSYPGPLSAPFVAWRYRDGDWTAMYADDLAMLPSALDIEVKGTEIRLSLTSQLPCSIQRLKVRGSWESMAQRVRNQWKIRGAGVRLADRFDRIDFYVHQWVSGKDDPPLRVDWTVDKLRTAMLNTNSRTLVHLYGLDPGGVDLGGKYFWSEGAELNARTIIATNTNISYLSWLNLRTFKYAVPRLDQTLQITDEIRGMGKLFDGKIRDDDNYTYKAIDMCMGNEKWQASRIREFDKLVKIGFKVIQLDEFPISPVWHVSACGSAHHLHRANDPADEWDKTIAFIKALAERAAKDGVLLTCEEPSAALLPYISGYIDRQYNDSIDLYWMRSKSKLVKTVPVFSTMFGDLVTPYTDIDGPQPARKPPSAWLQAHKVINN